MSKLYRSMLWSGLVVAGVAACGDDVSIVQPPPPVLTVRSISVAPNGVTVGIGANVITMSAAVNADAGVTNLTVVWSTSDASKATVSQTGQVTTLAAGSVAIIACSQLAPSVCGNATLTIAVNAPVVNSVTVTPSSASFVVGQPPVTFVASVQGTNSPAQTVTWSTASGGSAVVSVGATTGVVTVVGAGTEVVKACATAAPTVCGSSSVTVQVAAPTQISIQGITQGGTTTPVDLSNVSGQVDVVLNVDPGAGSLVKVQVLIDGVVAAEQCFIATCPVSLRVETDPVSAVQTVVLSLNTRQVKKLANGLYVPVAFNGPRNFSAKLFTSLTTSGQSSNVIPVVLQNADAWVPGTTPVLTPASTSPSFTIGSTTWYKADINFVGGANYISFFPVTPSITFGSACGSSGNAVVGTFSTGISFSGTLPCAGTSTISGAVTLSVPGTVTPGTAPAADVIYIAADTETTEQVGTVYIVNGDERYNLLDGGTIAAGNSVFIDTKAPVITPNEIGFRAGCSATIPTPGCWINGVYNLAGDFPATDVGGTGIASVNTFSYVPVFPFVCTSSSLTPATAPEVTSPTTYNACAVAADNLGNTTTAFGFNPFGVDKTNPTIAYAKDPLVAAPLYTPNSTLAEAVPAQALDWKVNDNNSGLDTATALNVATTGTTLNGACATTINAALNAEPSPGADRFMIPANVVAPDRGCGDPGYYHYLATVTDRAGNSASDIDRIFGFEPGVPSILALAPSPLYGGGTQTNLTVFATHTGASLSAAKMGIWYTSNAAGPVATPVQLIFDQGQIFNAPFQTPLFLNTPTAGTTLSVSAANSLAGLVIDSTQVPVSAFDSLTAIIRDVFDASGLTGALVHADTAHLANPLAFIDATKVSTSATVWANPAIGAATFSGAGACTFTYATPTNGPTIPTSVLVVRTIVANIYDVLFPITAAPTLLSDNGTTRIYQYSVSGSTCASFGGTLRLIAVKNDGAGLPVGYLVP